MSIYYYRCAITFELTYVRVAPNSRMQPTALRALTDWDSDVDELIALYENPDAFTNDQIVDIVIRFSAHVPNHVAAAKNSSASDQWKTSSRLASWSKMPTSLTRAQQIVGPELPPASFSSNAFGTTIVSLTGGNPVNSTVGRLTILPWLDVLSNTRLRIGYLG